MTSTIGQLKPGDIYANGKYRCRSNDGEIVVVRRLADNWIIEFKKGSVNWGKDIKVDSK